MINFPTWLMSAIFCQACANPLLELKPLCSVRSYDALRLDLSTASSALLLA
jgi:hypothetical protein